MILSELTSYLARHRQAPLMDLVNRFGSSPEALRAMLGVLARKGRVRRVADGSACASGCRQCDPASVEIYEWVDPAAAPDRAAPPPT